MNSIVEAVAIHAKTHPEKFCIADRKNEFTYRGYWECIFGYAKHLQDLGIKKGDCVVVRNSQSIETVVTGLAIQLLGAIFVPIEKDIADARALEIMKIVEAKCYIAAKAMEVSCQYENINEVLNWKDKDADDTFFVYPESNQTAEILFTTGTTGTSKGIELIHKNVVAVAENVIDGVEMEEDNVELIPVPLSHSHGLRRYYSNMLKGASVVILNGVMFAKVVFDHIEKYHVNAIDLVPAALSSILRTSGDKFADYKDQIRYIQLGSAPIPENDKAELCRMLPNSRLYNFYGTTESGCSCIIDFNAYKEKKNCIGRPTCHANFVFLNDAGEPIEATKENPGLLACAGDMNMVGYYKADALNADIMQNGYIRTQDLSYLDEDGMICLLGRQGDVIESGGNKISPIEIEEVAITCDIIDDCACIPVDNAILGKEPKLFVVMKKGCEFDYLTIYNFLDAHLEKYKVPRIIEQIDVIPRTYNGKISRKDLK